jgi:hypothetical protein
MALDSFLGGGSIDSSGQTVERGSKHSRFRATGFRKSAGDDVPGILSAEYPLLQRHPFLDQGLLERGLMGGIVKYAVK